MVCRHDDERVAIEAEARDFLRELQGEADQIEAALERELRVIEAQCDQECRKEA